MRHREHRSPQRAHRRHHPTECGPGWWPVVALAFVLLGPPPAAGRPAAHGERPPPAVERKLSEALPIARARLEEVPACRELFADLGDDGLARLELTRYARPTLVQEQRLCRGHASAFTGVGHGVTWLCRSFASLRPDQAAVVLIHEALHFAGLTEQPADPKALASAGINRLVAESCEL